MNLSIISDAINVLKVFKIVSTHLLNIQTMSIIADVSSHTVLFIRPSQCPRLDRFNLRFWVPAIATLLHATLSFDDLH